MKNLLITFCLIVWVTMSGIAQTDYMQWEVGYIKVKAGQTDMFKKAVAAHNSKYHASDPYKVYMWDVQSGPHSGEYFVALGPATFTQLDSRPSSPEHNADWQNNVLQYVENEGETSYWRQNKDLDYRPEGSATFTKSRLRWATLNPGQSDRWTEQMKKVNEVFKAKKYGAAWSVYMRYGASTGPNVCTEMDFSNWAFLDNSVDFEKDFDEVHGTGAYARFMEEITLAVDRTKTFDELVTFLPELSSK